MMQTIELAGPAGQVLKIETEMQEVIAGTEPDPGWRHTDAAGHEHRHEVAWRPAGTLVRRAGRQPTGPELAMDSAADGDWEDGLMPRAGDARECDWYPTLLLVTDGAWWCSGHDGHWVTDAHYECRRCGERVVPGVLHDVPHRFPAGRWCTLDGKPIGREQAVQLALAWQRQWAAEEAAREAAAAAARVRRTLGVPDAADGQRDRLEGR